MRAVILNGALPGDDGLRSTEQALDTALAGRGWDVERRHLRDLAIVYCQGCFECWTKTPGVCKTKDASGDVTRAIVRSDLVVFLSPVTFGGYSSELKKALDRAIGILLPFFSRVRGEVHHQPRYGRCASLLGVGVLAEPDGEQERIFATLLERNATNLFAPAHLAGFVYRTDSTERMRATVGNLVARVTAAARRGAA